MTVDLNLSGWIERRRSDVGPYAEPIIKGVAAYEAEISRLRELLLAIEINTATGEGLTPAECMNIHLMANVRDE